MTIVVDTNILARTFQPAHRHYPAATDAVRTLRLAGQVLCVVPQVLYEFWVVCTRPVAGNGLGMTVAQADAACADVEATFAIVDDTPAVRSEWRRLVVRHAVLGKPAHDARLVAAMNVHGVNTILTFNDGDFARYPGITVLTPWAVLGLPPIP